MLDAQSTSTSHFHLGKNQLVWWCWQLFIRWFDYFSYAQTTTYSLVMHSRAQRKMSICYSCVLMSYSETGGFNSSAHWRTFISRLFWNRNPDNSVKPIYYVLWGSISQWGHHFSLCTCSLLIVAKAFLFQDSCTIMFVVAKYTKEYDSRPALWSLDFHYNKKMMWTHAIFSPHACFDSRSVPAVHWIRHDRFLFLGVFLKTRHL